MSTVLLLAGLKTDVSECHAVSSTSCPALPGPPPPPLYSRDVATVLATSSPAPLPLHCRKFPGSPGNKENFVTIGAMPAASKTVHFSTTYPHIVYRYCSVVVIGNIVCTVLALSVSPYPYHAMTVYCHAHDVLCLQHTRDRPVP